DVTDLRGKVTGHEIHVVGEVFPGAGDTFDFCLAAEFAFGADFAGYASYFRGKRTKLINHRVDGVFQLKEFAANVDGDFLGEVAVADGGGHGGDVTDLGGQVRGHQVDVVGKIFPGTGDAFDFCLAA